MMKYPGKTARLALLVFLCLLLLPREAHAYIDPATGSYVVQIVIAVVVGGLFVAKQYFAKIKDFIRNLSSKGKKLD